MFSFCFFPNQLHLQLVLLCCLCSRSVTSKCVTIYGICDGERLAKTGVCISIWNDRIITTQFLLCKSLYISCWLCVLWLVGWLVAALHLSLQSLFSVNILFCSFYAPGGFAFPCHCHSIQWKTMNSSVCCAPLSICVQHMPCVYLIRNLLMGMFKTNARPNFIIIYRQRHHSYLDYTTYFYTQRNMYFCVKQTRQADDVCTRKLKLDWQLTSCGIIFTSFSLLIF